MKRMLRIVRNGLAHNALVATRTLLHCVEHTAQLVLEAIEHDSAITYSDVMRERAEERAALKKRTDASALAPTSNTSPGASPRLDKNLN